MDEATEKRIRNEAKRAAYFVQRFEEQVKRARGGVMRMSHEGNEAMKRVKALKKKHSGHPDVEALFARVRAALMASKGQGFVITPQMLAYRDQEQQMLAALSQRMETEWAALKADAQTDVFPIPDPRKTDLNAMTGRTVLLTEVSYPDNEFTDTGRQYLYVGDAQRGFWFIDLSSRAWQTAYAALRRFQDTVSGDLPQPWTVLAEVKDVALLVPQAGASKSVSAALGWRVEPRAIYVAGRVLALPATADEERGRFVGEDEAETLRSAAYTVSEIPDGASPQEVLRVFATAIKEKNFPLFKASLHRRWHESPKGMARAAYYWKNNQERYRTLYVHVEPDEETAITVISGERIEEDEDFFMTDEDVSDVMGRAEPLVEQARVTVRRYDERGRQVGSPNPIDLRRTEGEQWRVLTGFPL